MKYVSSKTEPKGFSHFIEKLLMEPTSAGELKGQNDNTQNDTNNN